MEAGALGDARDLLIQELGVYSQQNGVRVVVAFDAMGAGGAGGGSEGGVTEELDGSGVTVAYCGGLEADSYIEAAVAEWLGRGYARVVVATSDEAHRAVVLGKTSASGAQVCWVVPASGLIKDMASSRARLDARLAEQQALQGGRLGAAVAAKDDGAYATLESLRTTLPWQQRAAEAAAAAAAAQAVRKKGARPRQSGLLSLQSLRQEEGRQEAAAKQQPKQQRSGEG